MVHFHVQLHHLIHVEWLHAARDRRPQRVANEIPRMMVAEKLWIILEDRALAGLLHVHLHRQQALFAHFV